MAIIGERTRDDLLSLDKEKFTFRDSNDEGISGEVIIRKVRPGLAYVTVEGRGIVVALGPGVTRIPYSVAWGKKKHSVWQKKPGGG